MAKPEWGAKRSCLSCGAKFYDMKRDPVVCPKCGAVLDLEALNKPRRTRAVAAEPKAPKPAPKRAPVVEEETEASDDDVGVDIESDDDDEDEDVLEDASELGEDEDDMAEVIDGVEDEKEDR